MGLADKQRAAKIKERGEPKLRLDFDVFDNDDVSMWTHFQHGDDFATVRKSLVAIRDHLNNFLNDESMCPFRKPNSQPE